MKFKLGISIYSVPDRSIDILIDFVQTHNFSAIELWDSPLSRSNVKLSKYLDVGDKIISVHAPLLDLGDGSTFKINVQKLRNTIERANLYGAKNIVLHTEELNGQSVSNGINTVKKVIDSNLEILEKYSMALNLENVGYLGNDLISNFEQLTSLVDNFPKHLVGIVFDVSHANLTGGIESGIEILSDKIKLVHLSDNSGDQKEHHMPIGEGNIDFKQLFKYPYLDGLTALLEITPNNNWQKNLLDSRNVLQKLNLC